MKPNCLTQMQVLQAKTKGSLWVLFCCFDLAYLDSSRGRPKTLVPSRLPGVRGQAAVSWGILVGTQGSR